jgi:putative tryptophan/tyrosine transport system substrate-binding protein
VRTCFLAWALAAGVAFAADPAPQRVLLVTPHRPGDAPATRYEQRLGEAISARGYRAGREFVLEARHSGFDMAVVRAFATEAAGHPPAVVVCATAACASTFAEVTATIPIVFSAYSDPVADGLAESLARPGRNLTGTTSYLAVEAKQMEVLKQAFPSIRDVVILEDEEAPMLAKQRERLAAAASAAGMRSARCVIAPGEKDFALGRCGRLAPDAALYVPISNRFFQRAAELVASINRLGQPAIYEFAGYVAAGGLFSLEPKRRPVYEDLAYLVDQVIRGTSPAELPIVRPRETRIVVNREAMGRLRHPISPEVLKRAEILQP